MWSLLITPLTSADQRKQYSEYETIAQFSIDIDKNKVLTKMKKKKDIMMFLTFPPRQAELL